MSDVLDRYNSLIGEKVIGALQENGFEARYFNTTHKAREFLLNEIPESSSVGVAGSITLREIGLVDELENRGNTVYNHWKKDLSKEEKVKVIKNEMNSEVFVTGTNAITMTGKLVNIDGSGNRVSAMIFGPDRVIVVAGINKVTKDEKRAIERIKEIASPMNAMRLNLDTPCSKTGICNDCDSPQRICNATTILDKKPTGKNILVIIIGEKLGY